MVKIPRPEEPIHLKERWKEELQRNRKIAIASIKQGTWFTKSYWDSYKDVLKAQGVTWQDPMEAYGLCQYKFIKWIKGKISWEKVISALEEQLNIIRIKRVEWHFTNSSEV